MPEKVLKSPDLGFLEKCGDPGLERSKTHFRKIFKIKNYFELERK